MLRKRGQFYIIAAFIIAGMIIGFASLANYSSEDKEESEVYDLGKELGIESGEVIDHGIFHTENRDDILDLIQKFADDYVRYAEGKLDAETWYFVYWDETGLPPEIFVYSVEPVNSNLDAGIGGYNMRITDHRGIIAGRGHLENFIRKEGDVSIYSITIFGEEREVPLKEGIGLYFLISEERGDEKHVVESK